MVRSGLLCKGCGAKCKKERQIMVACPLCNESGCKHCTDGEFEVECPREYVGQLAQYINLAGMCGDGTWPVAGGLLAQSSWFLDLFQALNENHNQISDEGIKQDVRRSD